MYFIGLTPSTLLDPINAPLLSTGVPVVAADGKGAGTETCKSEADATFRWEDLLINVECKRPQSQGALGKLTKEARKQIEHPSRGGCHGVIALDCSVVARNHNQAGETDGKPAMSFSSDVCSTFLMLSPKTQRRL